MKDSPDDGRSSDGNAASGRDQRMLDLRRTLNDLDSLLGETSGADRWGLAEVMATYHSTKASETGARPPTAASDRPAPTARRQMSDAIAVPPSRTALLPRSRDNRSLQLITRFAAGAVILGLEELVKRGQRWEEAAPPEVLTGEGAATSGGDTDGALIRYWILGMVSSARRSAWGLAVDALEAPGSVVGVVGRSTDRVLGSWLFRPVRQPVSSAVNGVLNRIAGVSESWIAEGREEERISRWIAENGIDEIVNDVIAMISKNPELADLVSDQLKGQSADIVSNVADTSRRLSAVTDDVAETFVRRLLRRGPRTDTIAILPLENEAPSAGDASGR